jgi:hypothetical protein
MARGSTLSPLSRVKGEGAGVRALIHGGPWTERVQSIDPQSVPVYSMAADALAYRVKPPTDDGAFGSAFVSGGIRRYLA